MYLGELVKKYPGRAFARESWDFYIIYNVSERVFENNLGKKISITAEDGVADDWIVFHQKIKEKKETLPHKWIKFDKDDKSTWPSYDLQVLIKFNSKGANYVVAVLSSFYNGFIERLFSDKGECNGVFVVYTTNVVEGWTNIYPISYHD